MTVYEFILRPRGRRTRHGAAFSVQRVVKPFSERDIKQAIKRKTRLARGVLHALAGQQRAAVDKLIEEKRNEQPEAADSPESAGVPQ